MKQDKDVREFINDIGLNRTHILICALLFLAVTFDGYSTFCPGFMIPFVITQWGLTKAEAGTLMSAGLVGFTIGSLFVGQIADRFGRKPILLLSLLFATVLNISIPVVGDRFESFIFIRVIAGLGQGALLPLCATLINEVAPRKYSNTLAGFVISGMGAGGLMAALFGLAAKHVGWHIIYYACIFGIVPLAFGTLYLPESPRYLCLQGRTSALTTTLARLSRNSVDLREVRFYLPERNKEKASFIALLSPYYRRNTITVLAASFCCLFVMYGISAWVPEVMSSEYGNMTLGLLMGGVLQVASIAGMLVCGALGDRWLLRTLVSTWLFGAIALVLLAYHQSLYVAVAACAAAGFGVIGGQPLLNNLTAKLYETEIRATAVGVELGFGRIGAVLGPFLGGGIQQILPGVFGLFISLAIIMAAGALIILFVKLQYVDDVVIALDNHPAEQPPLHSVVRISRQT